MKPYILIIFLLAFVGCATPLETTSKTTEVIRLSPTTVLSVAPSITIKSTSTAVDMPKVTASPPSTALPPIPSDIGLKTLKQWMEGENECLLPCWAGITPGQTGWEEARYLIEPMSGFAKLKFFINETCTFGECNEVSWSLPSPEDAHGYIYSQLPENKIHEVIVEITDPSLMGALSLQNILQNYGKPAILLFSTEPDQPGQKFLELILVYPERQFIIRYSKYAEINGDELESCDSDSYIKLDVLDNREQLMSLEAIANAVETKDYYVDVWHKSVEEAAGMTIDTFYETYKRSNAPCITTPISVWQQ